MAGREAGATTLEFRRVLEGISAEELTGKTVTEILELALSTDKKFANAYKKQTIGPQTVGNEVRDAKKAKGIATRTRGNSSSGGKRGSWSSREELLIAKNICEQVGSSEKALNVLTWLETVDDIEEAKKSVQKWDEILTMAGGDKAKAEQMLDILFPEQPTE